MQPAARNARRKPLQAGFDNRREMEPAMVDSPYARGEFDAVVRNVRESSLATMFAHGQIDQAQLEAGNWFRHTYERSRMGSMAVDPRREPVDISGVADPIPDHVIAASRELARARAEIGVKGYLIVELVCGQGWSIKEAAGASATRHYAQATGILFRTALDALAEWRGFATKRK